MRASVLILLFFAVPTLAGAGPRVVGAPEVVFDSPAQGCAPWDSPDTPARAWRGADGQVRLLSGAAPANRLAVGPKLGDVRHDCRVIYQSGESDDPAAYDDRVWLHATHVAPDGRIAALAHVEYQGHRRPEGCPSGSYVDCWWNAVVELQSTDGGSSFRRTGPPVAVSPYRYTGDLGHRSGYFNPSNIVSRDGFLYVFVMADGVEGQPDGPCLLRRPETGDAADWRAWDGANFTVRFADPYAGPAEATHCAPVEGIASTISGIAWASSIGRWIAVTPATRKDPEGTTRSGIWWSRSADLVTWTTPDLLWEAPLLWRRDCAMDAAYAYPSLLDPDSPDPNFATLDEDFWLYLVRLPLAACKTGPERDLVRLPVHWDTP